MLCSDMPEGLHQESLCHRSTNTVTKLMLFGQPPIGGRTGRQKNGQEDGQMDLFSGKIM